MTSLRSCHTSHWPTWCCFDIQIEDMEVVLEVHQQ